MKSESAKFTILMVVLLLIFSGCGGSPPIEEPPGQAHPDDVPANPPGRPSELPASDLRPVDKPSLGLSNEIPLPFAPAQMIGFMFPDGLEAMKAAAVNKPDYGYVYTAVGIIEVGPNAAMIASGVYQVEIDLTNPEEVVSGMLIALSEGGEDQELEFSRTPLIRNRARDNSPSFPSVSPIVSSSEVCFVIGVSDPYSGYVAQTSANAAEWYRYCSLALLSVQDNFPAEYDALAGSIEESIGNLNAHGFNLEAEIDFDKVASEMESHKNIQACNDNKECGSDLTGAPNIYFWEQYDQALVESNGEDFVVTVGVVKIERELDTPGQGRPVQPGDYWVRLWFTPDEFFIGAALYGVTIDDEEVSGQTIPAIPSYFLDDGNTRNIAAWISGWRLCNWCKWQSNCP